MNKYDRKKRLYSQKQHIAAFYAFEDLVPEIAFKLVLSFLIPKMVDIPLLPKIFSLCFPVHQFKFSKNLRLL